MLKCSKVNIYAGFNRFLLNFSAYLLHANIMVMYNNYWYNKFALHKETTCKNLESIIFYERTIDHVKR